MTSREIFQTVARVVGQMALAQQRERTTKAMLIAWAESLESAAREMRRLVQ